MLASVPNDDATSFNIQKTHLVSISFDPAYDTAPVLRKYGLGYLKNDPAGFARYDTGQILRRKYSLDLGLGVEGNWFRARSLWDAVVGPLIPAAPPNSCQKRFGHHRFRQDSHRARRSEGRCCEYFLLKTHRINNSFE